VIGWSIAAQDFIWRRRMRGIIVDPAPLRGTIVRRRPMLGEGF
jgi:hypothetical protein